MIPFAKAKFYAGIVPLRPFSRSAQLDPASLDAASHSQAPAAGQQASAKVDGEAPKGTEADTSSFLSGFLSRHNWTNPSAGRKQWYRDFAFWMQAGIQLFIIFISISTASGDTEYPEFTWFSACIIIILAFALLIQRYCLEPMLYIAIICLVGFIFTDFAISPLTYGVVMREIFVLAAYHQKPWRWITLAIIGSSGTIAYWVRIYGDAEIIIQQFLFFFVLLLLSAGFFALLGTMRKADLRKSRLLEERAHLLEEQAKLAAVAERTRIAREMHDIVAHSLTGIIAQADGGRFAGKKDPEVALTALDTIAANGRKALQEMRDLLSVLRTDEVRSFNTAGIEDVPQLLQDASMMGLKVRYKVSGSPTEISALASSAVFRVVQEALTNAAKHAGAVTVAVNFNWSKQALDILISNPITNQGLASVGAKQGLMGLHERVHAVHGSFEAQPQGDSFVVKAHIPVVNHD